MGTVASFEKTTAHAGGFAIKPGEWRGDADKNPGGMLFQCGVHGIHELLYYFGPIARVTAMMRYDVQTTETADVACCVLQFASGLVWTLNAYHVTPYRHTLSIFGTRMNIYRDDRFFDEGTKLFAQETKLDGAYEPHAPLTIDESAGDCATGGLISWYNAIRNGGRLYPSLVDGARAVVFANGRSQEERRKVIWMKPRRLHVTVAQVNSRVGDVAGNLARMLVQVRSAAEVGVDAMVFAETCVHADDVSADNIALAEPVDGAICAQVREWASEHGMIVVAGMLEREGDRVYNSQVIVMPDGRLLVQRKHNITDAERSAGLVAGPRERRLCSINGVRSAILVCADTGIDGMRDELAGLGIEFRFIPTAGGGAMSDMLHEAGQPAGRIEGNKTIPVMAQWRRRDRQVEKMQEVGTLLIRYGINRTELLDSLCHGTGNSNANGSVGTQGGPTFTLQHRNKAIVLASPVVNLDAGGGRPVPSSITSLQTTIGLMNFEQSPSWEIHVGKRRVRSFPFGLKFGERILIRDGVSYIALSPVPATDLGRDAEVVISADGKETEMQGGGEASEALRIHAYNFRSSQGRGREALEGRKTDLAYGGFVIEMGDASEYDESGAFSKHIEKAKLATRWDDGAATVNVVYKSGRDVMELGLRTDYSGGATTKAFVHRRVNGQWPYLPKDMDGDSTLTAQRRCGRLEKNGCVLITEPGKMSYVQTVPATGTFAVFNPFPDPVKFTFAVPGGVKVTADGKVGIMRVAVRPRDRIVWLDHTFRAQDAGRPGMARAVTISGMGSPTVIFNGVELKRPTAVIPLNVPEPTRHDLGRPVAARSKPGPKPAGRTQARPAGPSQDLVEIAKELRPLLQEEIISGVAAGKHATVHVDVMGTSTRATLIDADKAGITVKLKGTEVRIAWSKVSPRSFLGIARLYVDDRDALFVCGAGMGLE